MDAPLPPPRLARKVSNLPPAVLTPVLKTLGLEEDDPEDVFEIHSKEGAGAFGRVFRASYRSDPTRLAALKVIPVALEAGQRGEDVENVRREIQFLRECDHPNVVAFFGAYYKDHALWVAMEYCGGGSVGDVSRRRRLEEFEIAVITRGALHGLAYLHARKKIHRDIKGGNILLTTSGEVKIADFGVSAQLKDTMSRRGTFVGTPYWMSPEMIQDSDYDYKSDIWSLGITLIELADQRPPLFDEHPMRVLIQIPRNPPPSVKDPRAWTPVLTEFLQFCLRKDPKERPSALECLEHAFIERVRDVPFVFAHGNDARRVSKAEAIEIVNDGEGETKADTITTPPRTMGSLTTSASDSEAMADDVTLRARPPKPVAPVTKPTPVIAVPLPPVEPAADVETQSRELERQIILSSEEDEHDKTVRDTGERLATPCGSESIVEEVWDLSIHSPSPRSSSRSDDDDNDGKKTDSNDAAAEGFAFRQGPSTAPLPTSTKLPLEAETASMAERRQRSATDDDDDVFEMPAMALISKIQAAASTLAGTHNAQRLRPAVPMPPASPLLVSVPSPIPKARRMASVAEEPSVLPSPGRTSDPPNTRPVAAVVVRHDLNSFSRSDSIGRGSGTGVAAIIHADTSDNWRNPLAQLTVATSHDRVNTLLSSLSASTAARLLGEPSPVSVDSPSTGFRGSLRGSRPAIALPDPSSDTSSSTHFIGSPFRVSHELNVKYNTFEAKFEGVPTASGSTEWAVIHRQFGIPLAHMRCRTSITNDTHAHVPALVQMLRRELVQRDGLHCKFIYRVSPDQSEIQHAKQAIQGGCFDASSVSDPHVFASLLKIWLRELPTPLLTVLTRDDLSAFVQCLVSPDDGNAGSSNQEIAFARPFAEVHTHVTNALLARLPVGEKAVLLWLVDHMLEVIAQSARNAMTAQSLAVVMAPNVFRWASTTPQDASAISKQVATLLRVLLAWRQRCQGGRSDVVAAADRDPRSLSVRSRPGKTEASPMGTLPSGSSISLRDSLNELRASLRGMSTSSSTRHDSTVSSILGRSSRSVPMAATHFVSAATISDEQSRPGPTSFDRPPPLEALLRDCVDGLWTELPLSILLEDPPPIVHALHATFQRRVLTLIAGNGRRQQEVRWANALLARLDDKAKAPSHLKMESTLPMSLRVFTRWLHAALDFEAFTRLLQQEHLARERLEKRWPTHQFTMPLAGEFPVERAFAMDQLLVLAETDQQANDGLSHEKAELEPDIQEGPMLDGAATFLRVLQKSLGNAPESEVPLAEDLVALSQQEPAMGSLLVAMNGHHMHRFHLEKQHREVVAMVERSLTHG